MNQLLEGDLKTKVKKSLIGLAVLYSVFKFSKLMVWKIRNRRLEKLSKQIFEQRNTKKYNFKAVDEQKEQLIVSLRGVAEIRSHLINGTFTCEELVHVYAKRCYEIGRLLCLSTEENFDEAFEIAKIKDQQLQQAIKDGTTDDLPPLHGIPISIKDLMNVKGLRSCCGTQYCLNLVATEDSVNVQLLKKAGAIILVKGNMPQAGFSTHTLSWTWGESKNPFNIRRTCGGSTGGDAGLVAARCVPVAIGSDIGGSIRFPAAFNGLCGLKPTVFRTSSLGVTYPMNPPITTCPIVSSQGPLAHTVEDLKEIFKILQDPQINLMDHKVAPAPFREDLYNRARSGKIRIGYMESLDTVPPTQSVIRGLRMARQALEEQGYEVVPISFTKEQVLDYRYTFFGILAANIMPRLPKYIEQQGERLIPVYVMASFYFHCGPVVRSLVNMVIRLTSGKRVVESMRYSRPLSLKEKANFEVNIDTLHKWMREFFKMNQIEAILMPIFPTHAYKSKNVVNVGNLLDYSILWNVLHYPCGVVPVSEVLPGEDDPTTYSDEYNDKWTQSIKDEHIDSVGMPLSVQVVAQSHQDEVVLGVMKTIQDKTQWSKIPKIQFY